MITGLYPVCDVDTLTARGIDVVAFVHAVLAADPKPALVQLRAKSWSAERTLSVLVQVVPRATAAGIPFVVNDHPELAARAAAPLVHVGQDDGPAGDRAHGRSTHTLVQLRAALEERPSYVAYGPVFATTSKQNPEPTVGLQGLQDAHALTRAKGVPLCAIGGVDEHRLALVASHCELVALIGALVDPDLAVVTALVSRLGRQLREARS